MLNFFGYFGSYALHYYANDGRPARDYAGFCAALCSGFWNYYLGDEPVFEGSFSKKQNYADGLF